MQNIGNKYNYKTIAVSSTNYLILKDLGKAGDSFNDVISKVLNAALTKKEKTDSNG